MTDKVPKLTAELARRICDGPWIPEIRAALEAIADGRHAVVDLRGRVAYGLRYVNADPETGRHFWIGVWNDEAIAVDLRDRMAKKPTEKPTEVVPLQEIGV